MKKVIAVLFVLMMMTVSTGAVWAEMHWGIKAGINWSSFVGDDVDDSDTITGFNAGPYMSWLMGDVWGIQTELLYTTKGGDATGKESPFTSADIRLNYLELPILFKYNIPVDPLRFNVFAGPYFTPSRCYR
jgi:hypothetical protein